MTKLFKILFFLFILSFATPSFGYINNGDYKTAYIKFSEQLNEEKTALNYLNMCKVTFLLNDSNTAKSYCNAALNILDQKRYADNDIKSDVLTMLGNIYAGTHNTKIPFDYYNEAKSIKERNPNTDEYKLAELYLGIAYAYKTNKDYDYADEYLKKVLKITKNKTDIKFKTLNAIVYNCYSLIHIDNNDYESAVKYAEMASKLAEDLDNIRLWADIYDTMSAAYSLSKNKEDQKKAKELHYDAILTYNAAIVDNSEEKFILNPPSEEELKELIKKFPYDNIGNYYMLIKNLVSEDDEEIDKYLNLLLTVDKHSSSRLYLIASAFTKAYTKTKNIVYAQRARMYLKEFTQDIFCLSSEKVLYNVGSLYLELNNDRTAEKYFQMIYKIEENKNKADYNSQISEIYLKFYNDTKKVKYAKKADKYLKNAINAGYKPEM